MGKIESPLPIFLPIQSRHFQQRPVGEREQDRRFGLGQVFVRVPAPGWHGVAVVVVPLEFHGIGLVDQGDAAALDAVVHGGAGVAVEAGFLSGLEQLQIASHCQECVAAVDRVFVFDV